MKFLGLALAAAATTTANAYWLMSIEDFITTERIDPVVSPGKVSSHVHSVLGGSNFRFATNTSALRQSDCTSIPIPQDKSAYWFPQLYFQWNNGSFSSLNGGAVIDTPGTTTAFPDDFRMISGDPTLRTYDPTSFAQQAVTFLCLDFNGVSTRHNELPSGSCPSGIRAQINFPSCWDGKNTDSADHKSHVAFLSTGPDSGTCSDPKYPVVIPRIFMELYWSSSDYESVRSQARNTSQPFVFSYGDPTGYGYHADFINGWDAGVLQNAVDKCHCNPFGDATCCVQQGIFSMNQGKTCRITKSINEQTTGTMIKLPGNNPVQGFGKKATMFADSSPVQLIQPVFAYTGASPAQTGSIVDTVNMPIVVPSPATSLASAILASSVVHSTLSAPTVSAATPSVSTVHPISSASAATPTSKLSTLSIHAPTPSVSLVTTLSGAGVSSIRPPAHRPTPSAPIAQAPAASNLASGAAVGAAVPVSAPAPGPVKGSGTCSSKKRRSAVSEGHRRSHAQRNAFTGHGPSGSNI